jgi:putative nucleotidyltransferase with HDIG domain
MTDKAPGRILVVDDEESIRKLLERRLSKIGHSCVLAVDGAEAIEKFGIETFDLVITDVTMPVMDGMGFTRIVRQKDSAISVIILTARGDMETAVMALRVGAFDYHQKPIEWERLAVCVANGIERTRLIRENAEYMATLERKVAERTAELEKKNLELGKRFLETVTALVSATEVKDKYTEGHSRRVAANAKALADGLKLSVEDSERIYIAGLLHDMGKIGIPDKILLKPGIFSEEERAVMQNHSTFSAEILSNVEAFKDIVHIVLHHHERYDGNGYPVGLKGADIPMGARVLSIADLFDAMTSSRPHKGKVMKEAAIEEIRRVAGTQVDPECAEAFIGLIQQNLIVSE